MHEPYKQIVVNLLLSGLLLVIVLIFKFKKKRLNLFTLLMLISVLPIVSIARPGTYESGDLTLHSVFLQSSYENLKDGIWIPQWAGGLCGGQGCPVFLFEYTLPFYIGSFFHVIGFSYIDSMKLFLATTFVASGISMFVFLKDEVNIRAAFVGSLLYLFAPIHLMEMHFRVSVGTHAAFIFIPLAFLFAKKSLQKKLLFIILGGLNFLLLILSHSSISFVVIPAAIIYAYIKKKKMSDMIFPIFSIVLGVLLSAFYTLPALVEVRHTWYSQTIQYVGDFKPFAEYIYSPARYGLLFQGKDGELRLIVGYVHLFIVGVACFLLVRKKYDRRDKRLVSFWLVYFFVCFLLMLSITKPLWNQVFFLRSFVLPWRMLVPIAFITASLGALITKRWSNTWLTILCISIVGITILNWGNRKMIPIDTNAYNTHWSLYTQYFDPKNPMYTMRYNDQIRKVPQLVLNRPKANLEVLRGNATILSLSRTQINHVYFVHAETDSVFSENTFFFPGWTVYANGEKVPINYENNERFGRLTFSLPKGLYNIRASFEDTPIRKTGKIISLVSLLGMAIFTVWNFTKKPSQDSIRNRKRR